MPVDAFRRAVTRGTAFTLASIVVMRAIGFLTSLLLARTLGAESFGAWSILVGFHAVAVLLAGLGLPLIAPKLVAEAGASAAERPALQAFSAAAMVLGLAAGALVVLASPLLGPLMLGPSADPASVAWTGAAVVAVVWSGAGSALLQGRQQIRRLALYNVGVAAVNLALVVPAAARLGVPGALAALAVSHTLFATVMLLSLPAGSRRPGWSAESARVLVRGLSLGWPLLASTLLVPLVAWLARTWLGRQAGLPAVAHFQVAETLNQAILFIPLAMTTPVYPLVSSMAATRPEEAVRAFRPIFAFVALFTLPAALVVGLLSPLWVGLFGPDYADAWPVVYLLTGGYFLSSLGLLTGAILSGFGMTGRGLVLNILWSALFLGSALVLVPRAGALGLAMSYGVAYLLHTLVLRQMLRRWLGLELLPAPRLLLAFGALFAAGWWLLPRVSPARTPLLLLPALLLALLAGGDLWGRALAHLRGWLAPPPASGGGRS